MDKASRYPQMLPGDVFDAMPIAAWNDLMAMAREWRGGRGQEFTSESKPPRFRRCNCICIKNVTENDLEAGHIVAISGSLYDPTDDDEKDRYKFEPIFIGGEADSVADIGRFAILQEPITADGLGYAAISGVASCIVDMQRQDQRYADVDFADAPLNRLKALEYGGAEILHIEGMYDDPDDWEPGEKLAQVRLGAFHSPSVRFVLTGTLTPGGYATGKIRYYADGGMHESDEEFDFHDSEGDISATSGKKGRAMFIRDAGRYEIQTIEC